MPFKKGDPRINRNGRPKNGTSYSDILRKYLEKEEYPTGIDEQPVKRKELIAEALTKEAMMGNLTAIKMIYDRLEGLPTQTTETSLTVQRPEIIELTSDPEEIEEYEQEEE